MVESDAVLSSDASLSISSVSNLLFSSACLILKIRCVYKEKERRGEREREREREREKRERDRWEKKKKEKETDRIRERETTKEHREVTETLLDALAAQFTQFLLIILNFLEERVYLCTGTTMLPPRGRQGNHAKGDRQYNDGVFPVRVMN